MGCRLLKGFYTASYKSYENNVGVEMWGRYDEDTNKIIDYQLWIHQPDIDSGSGYKTLESVEKSYEDSKQYFSKEFSHTEQREITTEFYDELIAEYVKEDPMKLLDMEKVVTVLNTSYIPYMIKYKELEAELVNDNQIEAEFPKGMYNRRMKQLEKLGYCLVSWIWEPTEYAPIWSQYRGVFQRA